MSMKKYGYVLESLRLRMTCLIVLTYVCMYICATYHIRNISCERAQKVRTAAGVLCLQLLPCRRSSLVLVFAPGGCQPPVLKRRGQRPQLRRAELATPATQRHINQPELSKVTPALQISRRCCDWPAWRRQRAGNRALRPRTSASADE